MGLMDDVHAITDGMAFSNLDGMVGMERLTYCKRGGPRIRLNANVERNAMAMDKNTGAPMAVIRVHISRCDQDGVDQLTSVDSPGDTIEIASTAGGEVQQRAIKDIESQDAGGWILLL